MAAPYLFFGRSCYVLMWDLRNRILIKEVVKQVTLTVKFRQFFCVRLVSQIVHCSIIINKIVEGSGT